MRKELENILGVGPSTRQPIFALDLLAPEDHARTGTVPVYGSDLGVVLLREKFRAALIARDGVERQASWVDHYGVDDVGTAARDFEFDRRSFVGAGTIDQCCTQEGRRGRRPAIALPISVWVFCCRYLRGVDWIGHTRRSNERGGGGVGVKFVV